VKRLVLCCEGEQLKALPLLPPPPPPRGRSIASTAASVFGAGATAATTKARPPDAPRSIGRLAGDSWRSETDGVATTSLRAAAVAAGPANP